MLLWPLCDISAASLGVLLPSGDSDRVVSRVGRVMKAPNVGAELQRGVTLGLRVVTLVATIPLQPPCEPAHDCPMAWDGREGPAYA